MISPRNLLRRLRTSPAARLASAAALVPAFWLSGCSVPMRQYRMSQAQAMRMHQENRSLMAQLGQTQQQLAQSEMTVGQLSGSLDIANQRLANLQGERGQLHEKYRSLLTGFPHQGATLPGSALEQFRILSERYPEFEFDPVSGVARFTGTLLFDTGSDALRPESHRLLQEFAHIINDPAASSFKILVVGHTDDQPIRKASTRERHPTNWDLSAHRATAVVKHLSGQNVADARMGVAGYSMYQPAGPNVDGVSRQQNRRVEIYLLAADDPIAARDGSAN
jgi:chemotaxis protein MotB